MDGDDERYPGPLRACIRDVGAALAHCAGSEPALLAAVGDAMRRLIARDDWLPAACAQPHPQYYRQYLLHLDPARRFSVVSFVWGPGQATPVHDHLVWGVIGVLRGAETVEDFALDASGRAVPAGAPVTLGVGDVACVSPALGDVHRVRNAFDDRVSVSIHVYGGDIGTIRRAVYDTGAPGRKPFVSGYANASAAQAQASTAAPGPRADD